MYVITATFDPEQAEAHAAELLALGDSPDHLAQALGIPRDFESVRQGVQTASFRQLIDEVAKLRKVLDIENQITKLRRDQSMLRFLGSGFKEKQLARLDEERQSFGSLIDAPRWFYSHPRVRLLASIRDYALDHSQQGDASWTEVNERTLVFPIAAIFEKGDRDGAKIVAEELEKPLKNISPRFLLESFEGHRSITFDFKTGTAIYYVPAPNPEAA